VNPETVAALQAAGRSQLVTAIADCDDELERSTLTDEQRETFRQTLYSTGTDAARPYDTSGLQSAKLVVLEGMAYGLAGLQASVDLLKAVLIR
jgi:hypothetical protein